MAPHVGHHHVPPPSEIGGDIQVDGKAKTTEEKEKPEETFAGGEEGVANIAQSVDRTPAPKLFTDLLQSLKSFLLLLQRHLAPFNAQGIMASLVKRKPKVTSDG